MRGKEQEVATWFDVHIFEIDVQLLIGVSGPKVLFFDVMATLKIHIQWYMDTCTL